MVCLFSLSRIGYHIPMFIGFIIMFVSTVSEYCPSVCPSYAAAQEKILWSVPAPLSPCRRKE